MVLELAALAGLAALAWRGEWPARRLPAPLLWGLAILVLAPLLQLVPLPAAWWAALPGREAYARVLEFAPEGAAAAMRPLTIHPRATQYSWLVLLPCIAVFMLTLAQPRSRLRAVALVFVVIALAEAALGVMQLGGGSDSWLRLGNPYGGGAATGTYVNRNHFGALIAMALPVAVALWALQALPPLGRDGERLRAHPRHADRKLATNILASMLVLLLLVGLVFSLSRAAIGSGLAAFALASLALVWRTGSAGARAAFALVAAAALAFAAYIGLTPVLERFAPEQLSLGYAGRAHLAGTSLAAALDFMPFGSGLGTYGDVYRRHQGAGLPGYVDHAHNDYVELFVELGVAGLGVMALLGIAYVARWVRLAGATSSRTLGHLQVAAGLGMLAMLVHGLFDFNFHIPANAIYFSMLAGIFFSDSGRTARREKVAPTRDEDRA